MCKGTQEDKDQDTCGIWKTCGDMVSESHINFMLALKGRHNTGKKEKGQFLAGLPDTSQRQ